MAEFKRIHDPRTVVRYASDHLQLIGKGSSRGAFVLSSRRALKVAFNSLGVTQNRTELMISTDRDMSDAIAHVHDAHPDGLWVVSDLVRPVKGQKEFDALAGVSLRVVMHGIMGGRVVDAPDATLHLIDSVRALILGTGLDSRDFDSPRQWGVTPDRRLVLLDYGWAEGAPGSKHDDDDDWRVGQLLFPWEREL